MSMSLQRANSKGLQQDEALYAYKILLFYR